MKNISFILISLMLAPYNALAANTEPINIPGNPLERVETVGDITKLFSSTNVGPQQLILNIIFYALGFLALFFVVSLIYVGFQWITSKGEKEKIEKAKSRIKNSVIGVVIILASYIIYFFLSDVFYKATCDPAKDYYCPSSNPNPTGECRTNKDCEVQFGSNLWKCDIMEEFGYGSCKFEP